MIEMNLTTNKQSSKKIGLNKHTQLKKLKLAKKHQYKMKV